MQDKRNSDIPDELMSDSDSEIVTERTMERAAEEEQSVPVIIKRTDEATRHPDDILEIAISEGLEQIERPLFSLALSSVAAGLILGFSVMAVAVVWTIVGGLGHPSLIRLATAAVYPLGFVVCVMSRTELFTEHTATAVYPVLDRKASVSELMRVWFTVLGGNLVGAAGSSVLLVLADEVIGARAGYIEIGHHLLAYKGITTVISAILAGWLMALGAWLVLSTPPTISQMVAIYIVTFLIGVGGLHHSIAGSVEIFTANLVSDEFGFFESLRFIALAVFGNLLGGSLFVAVLNYGHIRKSQAL